MEGAGESSAYVFPCLRPSEIVEYLEDVMHEAKVSLTKQDIIKPVPEKIQAIMKAIICRLHGRQCLYTVPKSVVDIHGDNANDLSPSSLLINITCLMRRILGGIGMKDFTVADLVRPEASRVRKVLSALVNVLLFRKSRMPFFDDACRRRNTCSSEMRRLAEENPKLRQRVTHLSEAVAEKAAIQEQLQAVVSKKTAETNVAKEEMCILEGKVQTHKAQMARTRTELEEINTKILAAKETCSQLKERIYPSFEHFARELQDLTAEVNHLKEEKQREDKRLRELDARQEYLNRLDKNVDYNFSQLAILESKITEEREQAGALETAKARAEAARQRAHEQAALETRFAAIREGLAGRLKQWNLQCNDKVSSLESAIRDAQTQREAKLGKADTDSEYRELLREQGDVHLAWGAERQRHERCQAEMWRTYEDLLAALDVYNSKLLSGVGAAVSAMQALEKHPTGK